ncbi:MAG: hypothetical protein ACP5MB_04995 [bacterium]
MGFLSLVLFGAIEVAMVVASFFALKSDLVAHNKADIFLHIKANQPMAVNQPKILNKRDEIETALIRYCEIAQSMIIQCQECAAEHYGDASVCPYPTVSFCVSATSSGTNNYNNPNIVWGFLPNNQGTLSDLFSEYAIPINQLTSVSQLPNGIAWLIQHQLSPQFFQDNSGNFYGYIKPNTSSGDACAVSGVVVNE